MIFLNGRYFESKLCGRIMSSSTVSSKITKLLDEALFFIKKSSGLASSVTEFGIVSVHQSIDSKVFRFHMEELSEILPRVDGEGKNFLQVNFVSGIKVLITDSLVGFKPKEIFGLDMGKLPKVVTTPDLLSVFEVIEESITSETSEHEIEVLKKVFQAILCGGEAAGFDLSFERRWLSRLVAVKNKISA